MIIPSLADALIVIVLLIPGFITFWIVKRIGQFNRPLSEFETSVWSFFFSAVILLFFTWITGLSDLDLIREQFFYPINFSTLFVITGVIGLVGGIIFKIICRDRTREESQPYALKLRNEFTKKILQEEEKLDESYRDQRISDQEYHQEQNELDEKRKKAIVTVFTKDNRQYSGYILHSTDDNWDILIGKAYEDERWDKILIKGEDISRIFFYFDTPK
jgi:small nuclear ribonucleoprotein (snRNP)-like protein